MSTSRQNKAVAVTKAYYEKHAEHWVQSHANPFHDEKEFRILLKYLDPHASVIDIGCAGGVLVPLFLGIGRGLRYSGIDITKKFISIAQKRYPHLPFSVGDIADRRTLPRKKFDGFIARAILMHLPLELWDAALSNIEHLSKPKAYGYIVLPARRPPSPSADEDSRHFTLLPEKEQMILMQNRGWKIVKKFAHDSGPKKAHWIGYIVQLP